MRPFLIVFFFSYYFQSNSEVKIESDVVNVEDIGIAVKEDDDSSNVYDVTDKTALLEDSS